jgi:general L-amino acid transport system permease protein
MEAYVQEKPAEELKPPVTSVGIIGWVRSNLFKGWFNSLLTIITIYCLWLIVPPLIRWAFIDSLWISTGAECQQSDGACWSIIPANIRFIIFGFFPYDQQWRPLVAMVLLVGLLFYSRNRDHWNKPLAYAWILGLFLMGLLMKGGLFGLIPVETAKWGGLPLTLTLSVVGLTLAYPLGIVFALGRRSKMPIVKTLCILYIELIRGVPLISLLFMSSVVFPLFLPEGVTINNILRAQVAIILFTYGSLHRRSRSWRIAGHAARAV